MSSKKLICVLAGLWYVIPIQSVAANVPASTTHKIPGSIDLGTVHVKGQQAVINALETIKLGLETPISSSVADQNKVVCRIQRPLGEMVKILDCSTNRFYAQRREQAQLSATVTGTRSCFTPTCNTPAEFQRMIRGLIASQPSQHLRMEINPYKLHKLLDSLPPLPQNSRITNSGQHH